MPEWVVGSGRHAFRATPRWALLPDGWSFGEVAGAACDARGRLFVFNRGEHPVVVLEPDGSIAGTWGQGRFARPHGITVAPDGTVWCTDDLGHCLHRFSPDGQLLQTLGTPGAPSPTGVEHADYRTIRQAAGPFNIPTNLAVAPGGDLYVSDGYGNARVHHFSAKGELLASWGEPGRDPGCFHLPHGIAVAPDGTVFVADRENSRVQLFSPAGELREVWTDVARPCQVFVTPGFEVWVAELGWVAGMYPGNTAPPGGTGGRVSLFSREGTVLARWGGGKDPTAATDFFAPHSIWVDPAGCLYVGEVVRSAGGNRGLCPPETPCLRRYEPLAA